jgi:hypothetical protein
MHKSATKCNETLGKWCKNKHGASKIIDTLETYQSPTSMDIEDDDDDKTTLLKRPRGHKATASDKKKYATALALSETFKGWMVYKEEAIAVREEKKRHEKEATANAFYDLTNKAIEVEESMANAKAIEVKAKLMVEERKQHDEGAKGLGGEAPCLHCTTRHVIELDLYAFAWD